MLAGRGVFEYDGRRYPIGAGDLFVADPGTCLGITSLDTNDLRLFRKVLGVAPRRFLMSSSAAIVAGMY